VSSLSSDVARSGLPGQEPTAGHPAPGPDGVAVLVLAAGRGERFTSGTKQVAEVAGLPLVAHVVATAWEGGAARVLVVVGHDGAAVAAAAEQGGSIEVVRNDRYAEGQATSLRAGLGALEADEGTTIAVVLLADQPEVRAAAVRSVAAAVAQGPVCARASYRDGPGHPVGFARAVWPLLSEGSQGDVGARDLLGSLDVAHVLVAGDVPVDVDTDADLEALRARSGGAPAQ
jgi:molybdenum cofactor cytidylyltransferase